MTEFIKGQTYTRKDVQDALKVPLAKRGGNWTTGYMRYGDELFVFCNVGTAGRTGHDYINEWQGEALRWQGRTGSTKEHPLSRQLIRDGAHIFWRTQDRAPFKYAGIGRAASVEDTVPVTITWTFD